MWPKLENVMLLCCVVLSSFGGNLASMCMELVWREPRHTPTCLLCGRVSHAHVFAMWACMARLEGTSTQPHVFAMWACVEEKQVSNLVNKTVFEKYQYVGRNTGKTQIQF